MILEVGALYIIFKTCRVASQLYPEESGKRLEDIKIYKNGIQLLCANSDPLWVWLGASLEISNSIRSKIFNTTSPQPPTPPASTPPQGPVQGPVQGPAPPATTTTLIS